jgi:hypothetical protein
VGIEIDTRRCGALPERSIELSLATQLLAGACGERGEIRQSQVKCRAQRPASDSLRLQREQAMTRRQLQRT